MERARVTRAMAAESFTLASWTPRSRRRRHLSCYLTRFGFSAARFAVTAKRPRPRFVVTMSPCGQGTLRESRTRPVMLKTALLLAAGAAALVASPADARYRHIAIIITVTITAIIRPTDIIRRTATRIRPTLIRIRSITDIRPIILIRPTAIQATGFRSGSAADTGIAAGSLVASASRGSPAPRRLRRPARG